jgi:hypothetical protein
MIREPPEDDQIGRAAMSGIRAWLGCELAFGFIFFFLMFGLIALVTKGFAAFLFVLLVGTALIGVHRLIR